MKLLLVTLVCISYGQAVLGQDIFGNLLNQLGIGKLLGGKNQAGKLGVKSILPSPTAVKGESRIEDLTDALTGGSRKNGESCFTRNVADKNVTAVTTAQVKKAMLDCDESWLRYRLLKNDEDKCLVKERTNKNVWQDDYQFRHVILQRGKDSRDVEPQLPEITCTSSKKRENSRRYLHAQKQICIDMRRAVEGQCDSCRLIALVKEPHRKNVAQCVVEHLDDVGRFARPTLRYCMCMEEANHATFPISNCKKSKSTSSKKSGGGLFSGLIAKPTVSDAEKKDLSWIGACMSSNFGKGESCLLNNRDGVKITTITPKAVRDKLVECERNTLRYRVDKRSGCVVRIPGIDDVWKDAQFYYLEKDVPKKERFRYKVIDNTMFKCGTDSFADNKRNLNIIKQICQETKSMITSKCDLCKLKTLLEDAKALAVSECANDRLAKPGSDARETIRDCIRKVAATGVGAC